MVSPMNEYEVLQLLLAECRDRLTAYGSERAAPPPLCLDISAALPRHAHAA